MEEAPRFVGAPLYFCGYGFKARDHSLRTLRQKHGVQGKFVYQMCLQQGAVEFERNAVHQREL